jgi:thimet oligopeptidase
LLERIEALRQDFERNVRDDPTRVTFSAAEMEGMPEAYLAARKPDAAGNYVLGLDQPSFTPFMNNARSEAARERYFRARFRKGGEQNLVVLGELFKLRGELAALYGQPTFAHYVLRRRMAGSPMEVKRFLDEVKQSLDPLDRRFTEELRAAKAADRGTPLDATRLHNWDVSYYREKLRRERYSVDQEKLRAYFPAKQSLQFVVLLASRLYGLRFVEQQVPVWHPDVRYFDVFDAANDAYRGGVYVDLFPRDNKRGGAAAYPLNSPSRLEKRATLAALEANFDREGFNQRELETLLHEFGHVLNVMLSDVDYVHQAINGIKWDFVEAPSQMFEEWARRPQTLALFREVCRECPQLAPAEVERLEEARRFGQASAVAFQWLLASFDMELALQPGPPLEIWKRLESATPTGHVEGTMFPTAFQHIAGGYASGYYGYMWSRVLARDMLSRFGDDLMDTKVAARYRRAILSRGSSAEESAMVRDFLGREPSSAAFFNEITGKR